ncbi:mechanosensitive ion channel domain-containing protein [Nitratiruptor sp. SB155-2]|uniref:mechanosensitive ion channel domain-containing protein n=1 Tax=Nitratiruptor sp. (strain SB155-2) TaxID=387092 RepID=UPI000158703D|nr:mechanosensitive ion channel domain-containing protein [Nitratiruptor sp. SB155-2]BAF70837.1 conserved hypothetical protein [Nitratiruptor sp. SB155-2]
MYKLINITKFPPKPTTFDTKIENSQDFEKLIQKTLQFLNETSEKTVTLQHIQQKQQAVKDQIRSISESNSSQLFTLQLQYAFYSKAIQTLQKDLQKRQKLLEETVPNLMVRNIKKITFDTKNIQNELDQIQKDLDAIQKRMEAKEVEKERLELLGRKERAKTIENSLMLLEKKRQVLLDNKLVKLFELYAATLQKKETQKVFALQKQILDLAQNLYPTQVRENLKKLLTKLDIQILGKQATIKGATLQHVKEIIDLIWKEFNRPLFTINQTPISSLKLIIAFLILLFGYLIGSLYKKSIHKLAQSSHSITPSTKTLLSNIGYYTILIISFFVTLNVLGIDLSSIALIAGALSVGIGFGLQNIVSNFVSGLILMFERSIKIGDFVEIDEDLRGRISDIRMRSTTITTNDNIDVIVPNQDLIQNRVINWTMNDDIRRFRIPFGVAYGTDAKQVIKVIKDAVKTSGFGDIYEDYQRKTRVIMTGMGDSSVNFELLVWIKGKEALYPKRTTSRFLILIYEALNDNGIEIPFPQRDLHIKSIHTEVPISVHKSDHVN